MPRFHPQQACWGLALVGAGWILLGNDMPQPHNPLQPPHHPVPRGASKNVVVKSTDSQPSRLATATGSPPPSAAASTSFWLHGPLALPQGLLTPGQLADLGRNVSDHRTLPACEIERQSKGRGLRARAAVVLVVAPMEVPAQVIKTVFSVLHRTPPAHLHEVVLCDDMGPDSGRWLAESRWTEYLATLGGEGKVRVLPTAAANGGRVGMLAARQAAVDSTTADVVTFLDSYAEVEPGWLEPMLSEIETDPNAITFPQMDWETPDGKMSRGGIGCTLGFLWSPLSEHEVAEQAKDAAVRGGSATAARPSPVFFGAVFSVRRARLLELGGFDLEFGHGGTDNVELAFRNWLCGGTVKCTPCSRAFIVFYKRHTNGQRRGHPHYRNAARTAALWMGPYGSIPRAGLGAAAWTSGAIGPVESVRGLQTRLACRDFQWFLNTVYPEADIGNLSDVKALGKFRHDGTNGQCLDTMQKLDFGKGPGLYGCGPAGRLNQAFALLRSGKILPLQRMELCLDAAGLWQRCGSVAGVKQRETRMTWDWDANSGLLREGDSKGCLVPTAGGKGVKTAPCNAADPQQTWRLQHLAEFTAELAPPSR